MAKNQERITVRREYEKEQKEGRPMGKEMIGMKGLAKVTGGNEPRIVISSLETDLYSLSAAAKGSYPAIAETIAMVNKKSPIFRDSYAMTEGLFISQKTAMDYVRRRTA